VAACGNSGRSPQPHLHLQVQMHSGLGGGTVPFHLVSSIVQAGNRAPEYQLVAQVEEGCSVQRAEEVHALAAALQLPVGRMLRYRFVDADGAETERAMRVTVTLLGEFRLTTDSGASAAFEQRGGTLGFYDRRGPRDALLDLWLLALGLTPLSAIAESWGDAPSAALLPLRLRERVWAGLFRPLGTGVESRYERCWTDTQACWIQSGSHELRLPGLSARARTSVRVSPAAGCISLQLEERGRRVRADLLAVGQVADRGVPAWEQAVQGGVQAKPEAEAR
jgi:hypothetical protein